MALAAVSHMLVDPRVTRPPDGPCDKSWDGSMYSDPALLAESQCSRLIPLSAANLPPQECINSVCSDPAGLTELQTTVDRIHDLIFAYLNVRDRPRPPRFCANEESQGEYGDEPDWDAVEMPTAFDDDRAPLRQSREEETVDVSFLLLLAPEVSLCHSVSRKRSSLHFTA